MWTYPESWAIEGMTTATAEGVNTFHNLVNKGKTPLNADVDLPVKLASSIPRSAMVARGALTLFNAAGLALTAYSLYDYMTANNTTLQSNGSIVSSGTCTLAATQGVTNLCPAAGNKTGCNPMQLVNQYCNIGITSQVQVAQATNNGVLLTSYNLLRLNANGTTTTFTGFTISGQGTNIPTPSQSQIQTEVAARTPSNTQLFDALKADADKPTSPGSFNAFVMNTARTDIEATPYVSPSQVVSTETYPMPDGSTETISIEEAYAYYPTLSGIDATTGQVTSTPVQQNPFTGELEPVELSNLEYGSEQIDYETFTQTNTTTTNNTTGQTSTTTTQTNHGTGTTTVINNNTTNNTNTDICQANPAILACQTLGTATPPEPVEVSTFEIETTMETPASVPGQCPQPIVRTLSNGQTEITYDYDKLCHMATTLRPFVILVSLVGAGFFVASGIRSK